MEATGKKESVHRDSWLKANESQNVCMWAMLRTWDRDCHHHNTTNAKTAELKARYAATTDENPAASMSIRKESQRDKFGTGSKTARRVDRPAKT